MAFAKTLSNPPSSAETKTEITPELILRKPEELMQLLDNLTPMTEAQERAVICYLDTHQQAGNWNKKTSNKIRENGHTFLTAAAQNGHTSCLKALLKINGIDVNQGNPLLHACQGGHSACVSELLQVPDIKIDQANLETGATPLMAAIALEVAYPGCAECVALLLTNPKIDVNIQDKQGRTALNRTLLHNTPQRLKQLLATQKYSPENILKALQEAKGKDQHLKTLQAAYRQLLNTRQAMPDDSKNTVTGSIPAVRVVEGKKEQHIHSINAHDTNGRTPRAKKKSSPQALMAATATATTTPPSQEVISFIPESPAQSKEPMQKNTVRKKKTKNRGPQVPNTIPNITLPAPEIKNETTAPSLPRPPAPILTIYLKQKPTLFTDLRHLLTQPYQPDAKAIKLTVEQASARVLEFLQPFKDKPSNLNALLFSAVKSNHAAWIPALVMAGADVMQTNEEGYTLLHWAALKGHVDALIQLLAMEKIEVNTAGSGYNTPLILAARNGHASCVHHLLNERHLDIALTDITGKTAYEWACQNQHADCIKAFKPEYVSDTSVSTAIDRIKSHETKIHPENPLQSLDESIHISDADFETPSQQPASVTPKSSGEIAYARAKPLLDCYYGYLESFASGSYLLCIVNPIYSPTPEGPTEIVIFLHGTMELKAFSNFKEAFVFEGAKAEISFDQDHRPCCERGVVQIYYPDPEIFCKVWIVWDDDPQLSLDMQVQRGFQTIVNSKPFETFFNPRPEVMPSNAVTLAMLAMQEEARQYIQAQNKSLNQI